MATRLTPVDTSVAALATTASAEHRGPVSALGGEEGPREGAEWPGAEVLHRTMAVRQEHGPGRKRIPVTAFELVEAVLRAQVPVRQLALESGQQQLDQLADLPRGGDPPP